MFNLRTAWRNSVYSRTVDTHVFSLRKKLEAMPTNPEMILTVSGVGYRFVGNPPPQAVNTRRPGRPEAN